jgi:uncharacterized membrane protein YjgN (DUF898 family)
MMMMMMMMMILPAVVVAGIVIEQAATTLYQIAKCDKSTQLLAAFKSQALKIGGGIDKLYKPLVTALDIEGPDTQHKLAIVTFLNFFMSKLSSDQRVVLLTQVLRLGFLPRFMELRDEETEPMTTLNFDLLEQV